MLHFTKNALGASVLFVLFVSSILFLSSCSDDDPVKDTTSPEVSVSGLDDGATVWNTVSLSITASDDSGVDSVKLYIDGKVSASLTQTPYDLTWDSNTVTDGSHTAKVVVIDKSGNASEKEISFTVSNTLLNFTIPSNQLVTTGSNTERGFVFLSDENGKVLASTEYENGKSYQLKNADFSGTTFFLTEIFVVTGSTRTSSRLWTWSQIERGKNWIFFRNTNAITKTYAGNANLTLKNAADNYYYNLYANGEVTSDYSTTSATIKLLKSPSKLLVTKFSYDDSATPTYGLYSGIQVGTNQVNLALVSTPLTKATITNPAGTYSSSIDIFGLTASNNFDEVYRLGGGSSGNGTTLDYYYPGTAFPMYYWDFYYESPDIYYQQAGSATSFAVSDVTGDVTSSFSDNKITYTASGDFDFLTLASEGEYSSWYYILPKGTSQSIPKLEIPAILSAYTFPTLSADYTYSIYNMGEITTYDDLKTFVRQSTYSVDELFDLGKEYKQKAFRKTSSGGRTAHPRTPLTLKARR
ncbi:MAG TPA: Ig-like domain-containing protein [Ohtaekwangia sp.]|uniref:Ig-like domain-containing protein n=1 Tax=Ohtaekwangia sp. TaxID=2066019 RepID=UPI002F94E627